MLGDLVMHAAQAVSQPAPDAGPRLLAGLLVALIVAAIVVRYLKEVLLMLAVALLAVLFVGIIQILPFIANVIESLQSATAS
jgi:uncharacterized RDD family membrane protein YckC